MTSCVATAAATTATGVDAATTAATAAAGEGTGARPSRDDTSHWTATAGYSTQPQHANVRRTGLPYGRLHVVACLCTREKANTVNVTLQGLLGLSHPRPACRGRPFATFLSWSTIHDLPAVVSHPRHVCHGQPPGPTCHGRPSATYLLFDILHGYSQVISSSHDYV